MALGFHSPYNTNTGSGGDQPKSRGLVYREQQLAAAKQERAQFAQEAGSPITGNVSTQQDVARKERALKRQQQYAAGQYPSGQ